MRIFCDTNIILEFLQKRAYADDVERVLDYASANHAELYISCGSFYTITYITEMFLKKTSVLSKSERLIQLRNILQSILNDFIIAPQSNRILTNGVLDDSFSDLEDSYQAQSAIASSCEVLLTINDKDFVGLKDNSTIQVLTPQQFVELNCK